MSVALLRARTSAAHELVDAAFGRFDLHEEDDYRRALQAHARALLPSEAEAAQVWPALRSRAEALATDLASLGSSEEFARPQHVVERPHAWGALYVVEGSRLGGRLLAQRVAPGLPHAYLSAAHRPGEWRAIRAAIDSACAGQDAQWHDRLIAGALAVFERYVSAAQAV